MQIDKIERIASPFETEPLTWMPLRLIAIETGMAVTTSVAAATRTKIARAGAL